MKPAHVGGYNDQWCKYLLLARKPLSRFYQISSGAVYLCPWNALKCFVTSLVRGDAYMRYSLIWVITGVPWWRHQMETFSALLAICARNSPVSGELPAQRPVTRSFGVFFDLRVNTRLSKQWWGWWFETLSRPLWRHSYAVWPSDCLVGTKPLLGPMLICCQLNPQEYIAITLHSMYNHLLENFYSKMLGHFAQGSMYQYRIADDTYTQSWLSYQFHKRCSYGKAD